MAAAKKPVQTEEQSAAAAFYGAIAEHHETFPPNMLPSTAQRIAKAARRLEALNKPAEEAEG